MLPEKQTEVTDDLLTMGKISGNMTFSIKSEDATKDLTILLERGKPPTIINNTGLIFHVFNSDFVEENIKPRNYNLNGEINGYIRGKHKSI